MIREDDQGEQDFSHSGIALNDGDSAALQFGAWTPGGSMPLTINTNGTSSSEQLSDESSSQASPSPSS